MRTVFLSSTARDLTLFRDAAYRAVEGLDGFHCVRMEDFGARASAADAFCREKIAACDVAVFLVGLCRGSVPEGSASSYTEREYDAAGEAGVARLVFLSEEESFYAGYYREADEAWAAQQAFRRSVSGDAIRAAFTTPDDLAAKVTQALANWASGNPERPTKVEPSGGPSPDDLRSAYLSRVFQQTCTLSLTGVDPKAASDTGACLDLGAVYTGLTTLTPRDSKVLEKGGGVGLAPPSSPGRGEVRYLSALEVLNRSPRLVLLGDPGSGKSTFVNFVALCLAGEALGPREGLPAANLALLRAPLPEDDNQKARPQPWKHRALLPVRVVLRDFAARGLPAAGERATAEHLWGFIAEDLKQGALEAFVPMLQSEFLKRGGLVLLDGLDEVPEAESRRVQLKQAVEDFASTFGKCRFLVTSRTYAYQNQEWRLSRFDEAVLAPFSDGQIRRFVDRWYAHVGCLRHLHPEQAQGNAEILKNAIFAGERLRGLAERPLLLTLMASLHAWRGGTLPERREELYNDAVELLLDWWEQQRVVRDGQGKVLVIQPSLAEWLNVERGKVRAALNEVAFEVHSRQSVLTGTADVKAADLVARLMELQRNPEVNPARLVEYLSHRAGLLLPRGVGVYTFPHRTFQEYLAACHLTDHDFPDQLAELARGDADRWREVTLLAAAKAARGAAGSVWALAEALCFREPDDREHTLADTCGTQIAGQALVECADLAKLSERNRPKLERIRRGLVRAIGGDEIPSRERADAGRTLGFLGDPRVEATTLEGMEFCHVPGGPFLLGDGQERHTSDAVPYGFWISRWPVTQAQFQAFVRAGGYEEERHWREARAADFWEAGNFKGRYDSERRVGPWALGDPFGLPNHPVVGVSWYEALAFTRWLEDWLRSRGTLETDLGVRLPSEAEWEKAARGGLELPASPLVVGSGARLAARGPAVAVAGGENPLPRRVYPWGDDEDAERANYSATGIGSTSAVGCFAGGVSPYGVEDLSGNVWEWTRSVYGAYPYPPPGPEREARENPAAAADEARVLRGGSFLIDLRYVHCACRLRFHPVSRYRYVGFRVVASPRS